MHIWDRESSHQQPHAHCVQFYKADEPSLNRNVGQFLWDGFLQGDALVVIAAPQRHSSVIGQLRRLGAEIPEMVKQHQITFIDAHEALSKFMMGSEADEDLFRSSLSEVFQKVERRTPGAGIRAYGEMVGILWQQQQFDAALRVEEFWNRMLQTNGITLFCGYPIDIFGDEMGSTHMDAILRAHTHLLPAGPQQRVDAVHRALDEALGSKAEELRASISAAEVSSERAKMPLAENTILWIRKNLSGRADGILSRAREHYQSTLINSELSTS